MLKKTFGPRPAIAPKPAREAARRGLEKLSPVNAKNARYRILADSHASHGENWR
jgi:hypothetical protein